MCILLQREADSRVQFPLSKDRRQGIHDQCRGVRIVMEGRHHSTEGLQLFINMSEWGLHAEYFQSALFLVTYFLCCFNRCLFSHDEHSGTLWTFHPQNQVVQLMLVSVYVSGTKLSTLATFCSIVKLIIAYLDSRRHFVYFLSDGTVCKNIKVKTYHNFFGIIQPCQR